ncbi:putative cytochrome P450 [Helianthus annuus]|uniref:Cytochrome P450 n=1 Tax=Helianthus annuus TaxID=4232 RepID=A0A251TKH7_HELAN|nr:cytochrome P450 2F3-like [Helianthus annuus]KAF5765383.1 putative cytochrome P450 [Helianthus annuus]KAJ0451922.1 putative cytochrome P450 [Helianthus annuus]KAJ0456645.1 putative cytochrome P450 [Helianthus annuus]KAJ0473807.1 putative cytochrome P450 [Helianthus annuus]KAJ0649382.1 putative cytochrome P450 [Helianthus annuus]
MIFRGTDTVAVLIEWILARLVLHPDVQQKVQEELDRVVGRSRAVTEADITSLVYLPAVVKEVLRLHPPANFKPVFRQSNHQAYSSSPATHLTPSTPLQLSSVTDSHPCNSLFRNRLSPLQLPNYSNPNSPSNLQIFTDLRSKSKNFRSIHLDLIFNTMVVNGRGLKRMKRRVTADLNDFLTFPSSEVTAAEPFRTDVRTFLLRHALLPPMSSLIPHLLKWQMLFRVGERSGGGDDACVC